MESQEILNFLRRTEPFDKLPSDELKKILSQVKEVNYSKREVIYTQHKSEILGLDLICSGVYQTFFYDNEGRKTFPTELANYTTYGIFSIIFNEGLSIHSVEVRKNTTILRLPSDLFRTFYDKYDVIQQYVSSSFGKMMLNRHYAHYVMNKDRGQDSMIFDRLFSQRISTISMRPIVTCDPGLPIFEAARLMEEARTSCLFVASEGHLTGYITDIVLRNKVVGAMADVKGPVGNIMEEPVYYISQKSYVYEAVLMMFSRSIKYLIVDEKGESIGLISRYDLLREQIQSPFIFIQSLRMSHTPDDLKTKWKEVPNIVHNMIINGVRTEIINKVITSITVTILQKVIYWSEDELTTRPVPYAIMSMGALGREEITLNPVFDCAIIYDNSDKKITSDVDQYFLFLVEKIVEKLKIIGLPNALGDFTSTTPMEVRSATEWDRKFDDLIKVKNAGEVFPAEIFDIKFFFGEKILVDRMTEKIKKKLKKAPDDFFKHLSEKALRIEIPLTFFKSIKTVSVDNTEMFDVSNALKLVTDYIRIFSLKHQEVRLVNTGERMEALNHLGVLETRQFNELMQSFYYLMGMRIKYQAKKILFDAKMADNYIDLKRLTTIEQITLKEIFNLIQELRLSLKGSPWKVLTAPIEKLAGKKV